LALEKIYDSQLIEMWGKIKQLAEEVDHEIIALLADKYVTLLEQNLESYEVIAEYRFSGAPPQEFKDMIEEEIVSIEDNNKELEDLKQEVIEKFNKKIAERLDKQKQVLVVENQNLRDFYDKVLGEVVTDVRNERNKNEFTLLDILYKQAKALDLEYQVKQYEMREKDASNNSGNE
jgi:bisphosphoglycerate-dependent phosphoglycerate mutase